MSLIPILVRKAEGQRVIGAERKRGRVGEKERQADLGEFQASLVYIVSSRITRS